MTGIYTQRVGITSEQGYAVGFRITGEGKDPYTVVILKPIVYLFHMLIHHWADVGTSREKILYYIHTARQILVCNDFTMLIDEPEGLDGGQYRQLHLAKSGDKAR